MTRNIGQLKVASGPGGSNSGTRTVPKLNRAVAPESFSALFSQLLGAVSCGRPNDASCQTFHNRGSLLFTEGQPASGVFIIEKGCVKLSMCSDRGRSLILGFFGTQSVLGLPASILGLPHECSAEILKPATTRFLPREQLLRCMRSSGAGFRAAEVVSRILYSTLRELEILWLTDSVEQKLARFLLSLCPPQRSSRAPLHVALDLTHEDIAQRIGVSRESVTRIISRLKKKGVLNLRQSVLSIFNPVALQSLAHIDGGCDPLDVQSRLSTPLSSSSPSALRVACGR